MLSNRDRTEIQRQVSDYLGKNPAFRSLAQAQQASIAQDTAKVVEALALDGAKAPADPYAVSMVADRAQNRTGAKLIERATRNTAEIGDVIGAGVTQAARMVREIDFPKFVASLIEGTFHAIVKSSMEQMKAYADMVKSVASSLNDFKDKNTTDNEARDLLANRYPRHLMIQIINNEPRIVPKDTFDDLPDFGKDFGLEESITDLDEETIEGKLVPAARDELARGRQQLLATIILMGINRIIVTDGKINAKIKFQFSANESRNLTAKATDYDHMGYITAYQRDIDESGQVAEGGSYWNRYRSTGENYAKVVTEQSTSMPDVRVSSEVDMTSDASIQASGQIMGEVSINFKSESFPLEKLVDTDQIMQLQRAQGAGRAAPPAQAPAQVPPQAAAPPPPQAAAPK